MLDIPPTTSSKGIMKSDAPSAKIIVPATVKKMFFTALKPKISVTLIFIYLSHLPLLVNVNKKAEIYSNFQKKH